MNERFLHIFEQHGLHIARMIGGSKTLYRMNHPNDEIYFNANIFTLSDGKIWHGDLNYTLDQEILLKIASEIGKDLYILREHDGRFDNEELTEEEIREKSVKVIMSKIYKKLEENT